MLSTRSYAEVSSIVSIRRFGSEYCLGQPMSITFDAGPPAKQARRVASAPSLINRIQKPALAERLGAVDDKRVAPAS